MKNNFRIDKSKVRLSVSYGTEREKRSRINGPWPKGSATAAMDLSPLSLFLRGQKDVLTGQISTQEDLYLRSVTLQFRLKGKSRRGNCRAGTHGSPYLALSDTESGESFIIARKTPLKQIIDFSYIPAKKLIRVKWHFNCFLKAETPLIFDNIYIRFGNCRELLANLAKDISRSHPFNYEKTERTVWIPPLESNRILRLKTLENNLTKLEENRLFYDQVRMEGLHPIEGDWLTIQKDFRGKIGFLNRRIEHNRMAPALSFAPLSVSIDSEFYKSHPDWLITNLKGNPLPVMDITRAEVRDYLKTVIDTFRSQWGFRSFHLKGLSLLAQPHLKRNKTIESGDLIRKTIQFFKENIGKDENLSVEGGPYLAGTGWINSFSTVEIPNQKQKASDLFRNVLKSGFQNAGLQKRLWINNAGPYPFGESAESLPMQIRESIRQMLLLTGGILLFRIDHTGFSGEEMEILKNTMTMFRPFCKGETVPLSYADTKYPAILYNTIGRLGVFNLSNRKQSVSLSLEELQSQIGAVKSSGFISEGKTGMKTGTLDLILPPYGSRIFRF